jgi:hypothetical protein
MVLQQSSWNVLPAPVTAPELDPPPLPDEDEDPPDVDPPDVEEPDWLEPRRSLGLPVSESGSSPHDKSAVETTHKSAHTMRAEAPFTSRG